MPRHATRWALACCLIVSTAARAGELSIDVRDLQGNALADAVVFAELTSGVPAPSAQPARAVIDQVDKQFVPRVSVMRAGTVVSFPNSDNIRHSVYSFSPAKVFTTRLYAGRQSEPIAFDKAGVIVLGCNIHDRMLAWAVVVDTPHFAKSGNDGAALLRDLPAGEYRLNTWYPGLAQPMVETVTIAGSGITQRQVRIDAARSPLPGTQT